MVERTKGSNTVLIKRKEKPEEEKVIKFTVKNKQDVKWAEDTVDNEHMNKKKSKICCQYSKPRTLESSDSSCCESDGDANAYDRFPKHQRKKMRE